MALSRQLSALSQATARLAQTPAVRGLRCPGGTGQWNTLTKLRLRRIADVQKQRLRQPSPADEFLPHSEAMTLSSVAYAMVFVKRQDVHLD